MNEIKDQKFYGGINQHLKRLDKKNLTLCMRKLNRDQHKFKVNCDDMRTRMGELQSFLKTTGSFADGVSHIWNSSFGGDSSSIMQVEEIDERYRS